jgi:hypothetical protein
MNTIYTISTIFNKKKQLFNILFNKKKQLFNILFNKFISDSNNKFISNHSNHSNNIVETTSPFKLYCYYTNLTFINSLSNTLIELRCNNNKLTYLPILPETLKILLCDYNHIRFLPILPKTLKVLHCSNNELLSLPNIPNTLLELICFNNLLTSLPKLPKLNLLLCENNPFYYYYFSFEIKTINTIYNIIHNFRNLYYLLKYKKQFHKWLWKSREKNIISLYHPSNIIKLLDDDTSIDKLFN